MKKALIGLAIAIVVALAIALLAGGPGGKAPVLGDALDAEHTVGFFAYENMDEMAARGVALIDGLPPSLQAQAPMLSRKGLQEYLGFDPADAAQWRAAGIDPGPGLAVVIDARVRSRPGAEPAPILAVKITDRDKLAALAGKLGVAVGFDTKQDGLIPTTIGGQSFWLGERGGFSFLVEPPKSAAESTALKTQFQAFLAADGKALSTQRHFQDAFTHAGGGGRLSMFGASQATGALLDGLLPLAKTDIKYYTDRFSAVGFTFADNGISGQMVATDKGVTVLNKLFRAKKRSKLARFVPAQGWGVVRTAANIPQFFDGLSDFIPPSMASQRAALGMSKMAMAFMGFSYDDLAASFTGYALAAADFDSAVQGMMGGTASIRWLAAAGVANEKRADALLETLTGLAAKVGGRTAVDVGGNKGYQLGIEGLSVVVARIDDAVLMGPNVLAIQQAIETAGGDNLAGTDAGKRIDDPDAFYAASLDLTGLLARWEKKQLPLPPSMMSDQAISVLSKLDAYKAVRTQPATFSLLLEDGIRLATSVPIDPATFATVAMGMTFLGDAEKPTPMPAVAPIQAQ